MKLKLLLLLLLFSLLLVRLFSLGCQPEDDAFITDTTPHASNLSSKVAGDLALEKAEKSKLYTAQQAYSTQAIAYYLKSIIEKEDSDEKD